MVFKTKQDGDIQQISSFIDNNTASNGQLRTATADERSVIEEAHRLIDKKNLRNEAYLAERQLIKQRIDAKNERVNVQSRLRPQQPTFDRSAKPATVPAAFVEDAGEQLHEVVRYFQAEPGGEVGTDARCAGIGVSVQLCMGLLSVRNNIH